jgi:hypothetical protein
MFHITHKLSTKMEEKEKYFTYCFSLRNTTSKYAASRQLLGKTQNEKLIMYIFP